MKKNMMLCIDLKTLLQDDAILQKGKVYHGELVLDDDYEARFVERVCKSGNQRNVRIFDGVYITLTYRMKDGHVRLNFKEVNYSERFNINSYIRCVISEIRKACESLGEEA